MPSKSFKNPELIVDEKIDTSETFYLETLKCNKELLECAFGESIKSDGEYKNEWRLLVNGRVYSIYDCEGYYGWHLGGEKKVKKDIKMIKETLYGAVGEEYNKDFGEWSKRYLSVLWSEGALCRSTPVVCPESGIKPFAFLISIELMKANSCDVFFSADEYEGGDWWHEYNEEMMSPLRVMEAYFSYVTAE